MKATVNVLRYHANDLKMASAKALACCETNENTFITLTTTMLESGKGFACSLTYLTYK